MPFDIEIASLEDFWKLIVDVWHTGFFGIDVSDLVIALGIFLIFLMARNLFTRFVFFNIAKLAKKSKSELDDRIVEALTAPIRFIPVVMGVFFATSVIDVEGDAEAFLNNLNRSLVSFTLFWAFFKLSDPLGYILNSVGRFFTQAMVDWMVKAAKVAFFLLGAATILEMWGIAVAPIIAGLGLFGVAVALGAQDLFKNLIAGLFVIGEKRFHPGDWILVDGIVEGTVEEIGFRTTKVRRFDKAPVYVPNAKLSDNAVTNFSRMSHRRVKWVVGLEYRTTLDQLKQVREGIERHILGSEDFAHPPEVPTFVRIDSFNDSSIDILLYCFTKTTVWGEWLEIKERLAYKVKEIVADAGTGFAFPSRSLYLETMPEAPEIFPLQRAPEAGEGERRAAE